MHMPQADYPPIQNVAAFHLLYNGNDGVSGVTAQNTLYVAKSDTWSAANLSAMAEAISGSWATNIAPLTNNDWTLEAIRYKDLTNVLNPTTELDTSAVGTAAGDAAPYTACGVVQLIGDVSPPPTKSYIRHVGLSEADLTGNHLTTAYRSALASGWSAVRTDINAEFPALAAMVIVSVYNPGGTCPGPSCFRDDGQSNGVASINVRRLIGRSVSRLV